MRSKFEVVKDEQPHLVIMTVKFTDFLWSEARTIEEELTSRVEARLFKTVIKPCDVVLAFDGLAKAPTPIIHFISSLQEKIERQFDGKLVVVGIPGPYVRSFDLMGVRVTIADSPAAAVNLLGRKPQMPEEPRK